MITIENEYLQVQIDECGGTLHSVIDKSCNEELLWQGDSKSWTSRDVVIFPIIARMSEGWYEVDNKRYDIPLHGIVIGRELDVCKVGNDFVELRLMSNDDISKQYPYKFCFYIQYTLVDNTMQINYRVVNIDDRVMYFGVGGHAAWKLDAIELEHTSDTSNNYMEIEPANDLIRYTVNNKVEYIELVSCEYSSPINLHKEVFANDALVLQNQGFKMRIIRANGRVLHFDLGDEPDFVGLWSAEKFGAYVCIEPWCGLPDVINPNRELKDKPYMRSLKSGKEFSYTWTVTI